jgi:RNA polymerase sigma-70 factor, ECF subfamily
MTLMGEIEASMPALRRYAWSLLRNAEDADDLVQDCLVQALNRLEGDLAISAVRPWLFTIMHNLFVSRWRTKQRRERMVGDGTDSTEVAVGPEQEGALTRRDLLAGLDQLTEGQREVLLLVSVEGLEYREVASILDVPVGTVMSRLSRARDNLHVYMDGGKRPLLRRVK